MDADIYCAQELLGKTKQNKTKAYSLVHFQTVLFSTSEAIFGYIEHTFRNISVLIMVLHCQQLKLALAEIIKE